MINPLTSNLYNYSALAALCTDTAYEAPAVPYSGSSRSASHVTELTDKQLAILELAFSRHNFGKNITIWKKDNSSAKLRETADLINCKLNNYCPAGLQLELFRLCSADSNRTIYQSRHKAVKGSISFPVKPEALSYIDAEDVSCLLIDVKMADGSLARVDITVVCQALEQEYTDRVRTKLLTGWVAPTYQ
ncbi:MAG: hypothetical protein JST01_13105 [Cyanobacteria bacterium SZAS TMP-1]|nr:hypothetical protein [Cyanobacteria bacterium SZAS TMP-1]